MSNHSSKSSLPVLMLGALGVVYGDIGTSPLYAFKEVFLSGHVAPTSGNVIGVLSLFFWALTLVVSLKYLTLILRADNHGEGGLMALLALASSAVRNKPNLRSVLMGFGIFGLALFFGDGVITPAISVLSAVEGLEVIRPEAKDFVLPISLGILVTLFSVQKWGTAHLGRFFGYGMIVWFASLGLAGLPHVVAHPEVLAAIFPHHAIRFASENLTIAFITLGAVFLCLTGAEALYADMGHFGAKPIRVAWFVFVMPMLVLNYFGQGALVLSDASTIDNPFYKMMPSWATIGMVILATIATIIASQALISGAFSAAKQTIQLGYMPRLRILHTSELETGQIYVPFVNWALLFGVVMAVVIFRSSGALAAAYGISVSLLMVITTALTYFVLRYKWKFGLWTALLPTLAFLLLDGVFLASNLVKIASGGWFPLSMALALYVLLATWKDGRRQLGKSLQADALSIPAFLETLYLAPPARVEGTAVFLTANAGELPRAFLHNLKHNKILHTHNLFLTVSSADVPRLAPSQQVYVEPLGHDCWNVSVKFGFMDDPDVPRALAQAAPLSDVVEPMVTSYFLSRDIVVPGFSGEMAMWRQKLFGAMHHSARGAAEFFSLPNNSVVELGSKVAM